MRVIFPVDNFSILIMDAFIKAQNKLSCFNEGYPQAIEAF